mmetsp:Transcript_5283/g.13343  ORF Transcript_5283/g.13343 Transcript_5283/m.13343 type:complete len:253 (-) Transcript_5283:129-887(-)
MCARTHDSQVLRRGRQGDRLARGARDLMKAVVCLSAQDAESGPLCSTVLQRIPKIATSLACLCGGAAGGGALYGAPGARREGAEQCWRHPAACRRAGGAVVFSAERHDIAMAQHNTLRRALHACAGCGGCGGRGGLCVALIVRCAECAVRGGAAVLAGPLGAAPTGSASNKICLGSPPRPPCRSAHPSSPARIGPRLQLRSGTAGVPGRRWTPRRCTRRMPFLRFFLCQEIPPVGCPWLQKEFSRLEKFAMF